MSQDASPWIRMARMALFAFDSFQRRRHHVYEFDTEPQCMLRVSQTSSRVLRALSDGTTVRPGDPVLEFHFWNERVPLMRSGSPDVAWGARFYRCCKSSLADLARYLAVAPELSDVVAVWGVSSFASELGRSKYAEFFNRFGFDFVPTPPLGIRGSLCTFLETVYVWLIIRLVNPSGVKGRSARCALRSEVWISRERLLQIYGPRRAMRGMDARLRDETWLEAAKAATGS